MNPVIPLRFVASALTTPIKLNSSSPSSKSATSPTGASSSSSESTWLIAIGRPYFGKSRCSITNSRARRSKPHRARQNRNGAFHPNLAYSAPPIGGACTGQPTGRPYLRGEGLTRSDPIGAPDNPQPICRPMCLRGTFSQLTQSAHTHHTVHRSGRGQVAKTDMRAIPTMMISMTSYLVK